MLDYTYNTKQLTFAYKQINSHYNEINIGTINIDFLRFKKCYSD